MTKYHEELPPIVAKIEHACAMLWASIVRLAIGLVYLIGAVFAPLLIGRQTNRFHPSIAATVALTALGLPVTNRMLDIALGEAHCAAYGRGGLDGNPANRWLEHWLGFLSERAKAPYMWNPASLHKIVPQATEQS